MRTLIEQFSEIKIAFFRFFDEITLRLWNKFFEKK